ncbi:class IIb bacteriocin, lactobin A/cerein 7B family [Capnocytophaga sputigena]|uniref:class IIb bacteriocin, lactobin A/cerein 7B family n=1 Tax=Capnocytophaga sputigena TaxID=1019 RepID=UPI003D0279EE
MNKKNPTSRRAQGAKKLDSFKGFETLNSKQLQEIEGGILPIVAVGLAVLYIGGTLCALADGKKLNGMP